MFGEKFVARTSFAVSDSVIKTYFVPHHLSALRKTEQYAKQAADLILEVRDVRIPWSSRNLLLDRALGRFPKLTFYNKTDYLDEKLLEAHEPIIRSFTTGDCVFGSAITSDVHNVVTAIKAIAEKEAKKDGFRVLIVGLPNVGKSRLLNSMRYVSLKGAKVTKVNTHPGVTRRVQTPVIVSTEPLIYVHDTPGVMTPYVQTAETMLKLALCWCVNDRVIDRQILCDYLLYRINLVDPDCYAKYTFPTNELEELVYDMAHKTGKLKKGGIPDEEAIYNHLLHLFRTAKSGYGGFFVDQIDQAGFDQRLAEERPGVDYDKFMRVENLPKKKASGSKR